MNGPADQLADDRRTREAAKANFNAGVTQVKADLGARSVPARVVAKARNEASEALAAGLEVAKESKGIIAGVGAAMLLWLFRAPLLRRIKSFRNRHHAASVKPDDGTARDD